jgi:transcriptional regulator with XRE-family HTH domain
MSVQDMTNTKARVLRGKKLGVLIQDARLAAGKNIDECAKAIGVSPSDFSDYEYGEKSPSLPELEVFAFYLDVPLSHFWGQESISEDDKSKQNIDRKQLISLRQRVVGTLLRQARIEAGLSIEELAERVDLTENQLEAYEFGQTPIPLPLLETISDELDLPIQDLRDKQGPVGEWAARRHAVDDFLNLPPELQTFVAVPVNRPFLELAKQLSEMPVERLRTIGEGILGITL